MVSIRVVCLTALAVVAGPVSSLGVSDSASAKTPSALIAGYVSAGAPVSGARLAVYGPSGRPLKLRERSDANGFFVFGVPGRARSLRLVATGGRVSGRRLVGSLQAVVARGSLRQDAFLNPVSTVVGAYLVRHPRWSLARATRAARHLLRLAAGDPIGRPLRHATPYFDGGSFLRAARAHGGLQRYVAYLIRRGRPVSFRGAQPVGGPEQGTSVLNLASNAISIISGVGSIVNDVIGWAQGDEQKIGQIWEAVQEMQVQLNTIQASLDNIQNEIQNDFQQLRNQLDVGIYNQRVLPLKELAGTVATTEGDFDDLVNNATSPNFSAALVTTKMQAISDNVNKIETEFNDANDLLRDGLLSGGPLSTTSAYYYAARNLLAGSANVMTPTDSAQLQNFANYVLQYQALAFNLIVRWETHLSPRAPTTTVNKALTLYLGSVTDAKAWLASQGSTPTAPPSHGDLHDELAYLATIQPVPTGTMVDQNTGLMWQSSNAASFNFTSFGFGATDRAGCGPDPSAPPRDASGNLWCPNQRAHWDAALGALGRAQNQLSSSTGLSGWVSATLSQAQALLAKNGIASVLQVQPNYWDPYDFTPVAHDNPHYLADDYNNFCWYYDDSNVPTCGDYYFGSPGLVDAVNLTTIAGSTGKTAQCTEGVYEGAATTCPLLYALLVRPTATTEQYWP